MPNFGTDFSPFAVRVRPGKRREELSSKNALALKNPSLTGQSSTSSTTSGTSTESEDSSDDESKALLPNKTGEDGNRSDGKSVSSAETPMSYARLLPTMQQVYGMELHEPSRHDLNLYRRYAGMASSCQPSPSGSQTFSGAYKRMMLAQQSAFTIDNTIQITTPFVSKSSVDVYVHYYLKGRRGRMSPSTNDLSMYRRYAAAP